MWDIWYSIEGNQSCSFVSISPTYTIAHLQKQILANNRNSLEGYDAMHLKLIKVNANLSDPETIRENLAGHYRTTPNDQILERVQETISLVWPEGLPNQPIHVFVRPKKAVTPTLIQVADAMEGVPPDNDLGKYSHMFVKVREWAKFYEGDIKDNDIHDVATVLPGGQQVDDLLQDTLWEALPEFVRDFEEKLERKPSVDPMCPLYAASQSGEFGQYFEHPGDLIADGESRKTTRQARLPEVAHITHIATCEWQRLWEGGHNRHPGDNKLPLNEHLMYMIFFAALGGTVKNGMDHALRDESWPFVILKREGCQGDEELRKFRPHSDFWVSNSVLPLLLVEVNSILTSQVPPDLIRMLIMGAFVVRFANKFLAAFKEAKDFVLCAVFVWDDGNASRYTLFQHLQHNQVYYHMKDLWLNVPSHRVEFLRILYNLLGEDSDISEEQNKDMKHVMAQFKKEVEARGLKSMHTEDPKNNNSMDNDDDAGRGGGGGGHAQLGAHGYEVKSDVIVDDKGIEWELMSERPDHVLTVYHQREDPDKEFIAKKVRKTSDELEILTLFDDMIPKPDHVIPLIESFDGWVILPKMITVKGYVVSWPERLESKVVQVCLGLIEGVAFLHEWCVAHRDIKPDNLVLDRDFCLKIIDFDLAMRVRDEDEEVDDQCGTKYWIAPEVENNNLKRHSPMRADRWACGRVLLYLLNRSRKGDERLKAFARNLSADDPKERPSLLGWCDNSASTCSDVGNGLSAGSKNASKPRRYPSEGGESTKPPNAKKRRLDGSH